MTINAGRLESDHWTLNREVGGGRIVGEGCHFVDLSRFLVGASVLSVRCVRRDANGQDGGCFQFRFSDGSQATIDYRTDLPAHVPKEIIEVSGQGFSAVIHNWSRLRGSGLGGLRQGGFWSRAPRKGHEQAIAAFLAAIRGAPPPIPIQEIFEVSAWAIQIQTMTEGETVDATAVGLLSHTGFQEL
jgi:predicted dehydrogenase